MRIASPVGTQAGGMATRITSDPWEAYARELGINLLRAREGAGMSQERVAHAAGISTFTYRKLEKGESNPGTPANPRLKTLMALTEVLNVDLTSVLPDASPDIARGR